MNEFKLRKVFVVEYYDKCTGKWNVLYHTYSRKLAVYQFNKAKNTFKELKYRLYVTERIL